MQRKILDPFVFETLASLTALARVPATYGDAFQDDVRSFSFKGYAVAAAIGGALPGKVLLHLYPETATELGRRVYAGMAGTPPPADSTDDDICEVLNEWANVLIGKASRLLEESKLDVHFAPPFFVHNTHEMSDIMHDVVEIISIPIVTEEAGRFYFNYLLHEKTAA